MQGAPNPDNEAQRIRTLHALNLLDTGPDERFDRLTRLAQRLFDTPIALVSLVDSDRQWFKSRVGTNVRETPRELAFCAHTILGDDVLIIPDASADERFRDHPLVADLPEIRFYAGCPVKAPDGSALGTLCVIDHEPREVGADDASLLRDLAGMLEQELKSLSLATLDELTGLTNRRGFEAIAAHTLAVCSRVDRPATLLLFDLDEFKEINDRRGHAAGDRVLQEFGRHLDSVFRDSDVIARLGGDEFCVLLSAATTRDVSRPLSLLELRLGGHQGRPVVAFSVGVAAYDRERHRTVRDLLAEADRQMYLNKRTRDPRGRTSFES